MKISDIIKTKKTISFEVFPPKKESFDVDKLYETIDKLALLNPDFISVTYGAMGSTTKETVKIASYIKNNTHSEALAHLTSYTTPKDEIIRICEELKANNITNIMSLRGDIPAEFTDSPTFMHASDLNSYLKEEYKDTFCLGGACYPEGHSESPNFQADLNNLKIKQESGAEFFVTQLFYDNNYYYRLIREARKIGITIPIIAGIMPVTNAKQVKKVGSIGGVSVPLSLSSMIDRFMDNKAAMRQIGISYATNQIIDLIANGADGIHIYTMNQASVATDIMNNISEIIKNM